MSMKVTEKAASNPPTVLASGTALIAALVGWGMTRVPWEQWDVPTQVQVAIATFALAFLTGVAGAVGGWVQQWTTRWPLKPEIEEPVKEEGRVQALDEVGSGEALLAEAVSRDRLDLEEG